MLCLYTQVIGLSIYQIIDNCEWIKNRLIEKYKKDYVCRLPDLVDIKLFNKRQKDTNSFNVLVLINDEPKIINYNSSTKSMEVTDYRDNIKFFFFWK